jgi:hypothetical protein
MVSRSSPCTYPYLHLQNLSPCCAPEAVAARHHLRLSMSSIHIIFLRFALHLTALCSSRRSTYQKFVFLCQACISHSWALRP